MQNANDPGPSAGGAEGDDQLSEGRRLGERILEEAPRLGLDDEFTFACHPGVSCFGKCCADVNIALTPYDVLRLRKRLGVTSSEFLSKYTLVPFTQDQKLPVPLLKMRDDETKSCHFVSDGKCTVYEDRPWACRMYPVGLASPQGDSSEKPFYFLLEEEGCMGFGEKRTLTIRGWIEDQEIAKYDEMGGLFQPLLFDARLADEDRQLDPKQMSMFWMSTYDLDAFRRFIFESSFFDRFEVSEETIEALREDDEALMRFAFRWLAYALSGKPTLKVKDGKQNEGANPERQS